MLDKISFHKHFNTNGVKTPSCSPSVSHGRTGSWLDLCEESPLSSTQLGCIRKTPSTTQGKSSVKESSGSTSLLSIVMKACQIFLSVAVQQQRNRLSFNPPLI